MLVYFLYHIHKKSRNTAVRVSSDVDKAALPGFSSCAACREEEVSDDEDEQSPVQVSVMDDLSLCCPAGDSVTFDLRCCLPPSWKLWGTRLWGRS